MDSSKAASIATFDLIQAIRGVQYRGLKVKVSAERLSISANNYGDLHFVMFDDLGDFRGTGTSLGIDFSGSPQPGEYQVGVDFFGAGLASEVVSISGGGSVQTCPLPAAQAVFRCLIKINLPGAGSLSIRRQNSPNATSHSGGLEIRNVVVAAQPDLPGRAPQRK